MAERKYYKAINFDLRIEALRKYYSQNHPKQAYREVKKFLVHNGFSHRQWSGYRSKTRLSDYDTISLIYDLFEKFPWLEQCATRFDVTNIGRTYDMLSMRLADKQAEKALFPARKEQPTTVAPTPTPEAKAAQNSSQRSTNIKIKHRR